MALHENFSLHANLIDPLHKRMGYGLLSVREGIIESMEILEEVRPDTPYVLPGFIDAHIHIESSMLTPPAFARIAVQHGTVATVSDPHEIANVCGIEGVRYMVRLGKASGFKFFFGAPSCVPATPFETAGATLTAAEIAELFEEKSTSYLSEMMNYPAVLARDPLVMDKIRIAHQFQAPVDGHAPGLRGADARKYADAGITTDHECTSLAEALDKIEAGMHVIIREGSAAKNFDALHTLISSYPDKVMFCSDDKHPDDLLRGHINQLVTRSLSHGYDFMDVLRIACVNPVLHYGLPVGLLRNDDPADFIMINDPEECKVLSTWISGQKVFDGKEVHLPNVTTPGINRFGSATMDISSLRLRLKNGRAHIIGAVDGAIVTEHHTALMQEGFFESDISKDILKIAVFNRYSQAPVAVALIHGFGLKKGAIASSVAHDSHNIVAVGTNDVDLCECIHQLIRHRGGISASCDGIHHILPLPVAGLMSDSDAISVGKAYEEIDLFVKNHLRSTLSAPFMTLSFMALLVIPSLKLSDLGLFDGKNFQFIPIQ